jgi:4-hydroxythreonine-4-phosphate dehydrogenase
MSSKKKNRAVELVLTMGDPSGIGPEILAKAVREANSLEDISFTIVGDGDVISAAFRDFCPGVSLSGDPKFNLVDPGGELGDVIPGKPGEKGALKALLSIEKAAEIILSSSDPGSKVLVTAPVCKAEIARVRKGFVGHTEFLQQAAGVPFVTMAFVGEHLRVVPVTRHVPLRNVPSFLTKDLVMGTILQVVEERRKMTDINDPAIMVTALNPHAGEGGKIGNEEKEIIEPAIESAREIYPGIEGPLPSDVAFYSALSRPGSIVVAMYHDQCLGPFKMLDFANGVNVTLGLGFVRTSPDHGTAFNIAGMGVADANSMFMAVKTAVRAAAYPSGMDTNL